MDVVHEIVCLKPIYSIKNNVQVIYNAKMTYKHLKYVHDPAFGRQSCLQRVRKLSIYSKGLVKLPNPLKAGLPAEGRVVYIF